MSLFDLGNVTSAILWAALLMSGSGCNSFSRPAAGVPLGRARDAAPLGDRNSDGRSDQGGFLFTEDSGADDPSSAPRESAGGVKSFSASDVTAKLKSFTQPARNHAEARRRFNQAETAFNERRYDEAIDLYGQAAKRWPGSSLEHDAMFMIAESYFRSDQYPDANRAYSKLLKKYDNSRYLEKAVARQFAIALYWEKLEKWRPGSWYGVNLFDSSRPWRDAAGYARETYKSIHLNDPTGPLADDALMAMASHFLVRGQYDDADYYYSLLRTDHPKSEHVFQAYLLGIQAKMRNYQGPDYDGTPLVEAQELLDQLKLQFSDRIGDKRGQLETVQREIRAQQAKRLWHLAEYYENRDDFRAARTYYEKIVADYPTNTVAQQARQRINQIASKPDNAPNYVPWLTNVFEPHERRR